MKLAVVAGRLYAGRGGPAPPRDGRLATDRGPSTRFGQRLIDGMIANGYSGEFGERLFNQIRGFG